MKAWDLSARKKLTKREKKRRKRSNVYFIFFLILITAFFIIFLGANKVTAPEAKTKTQTPIPANSTLESSLKTQNKVTIKILNGTGRFEEAQNLQKVISDSGFTITTTENALNMYDQTIIYFQSPYENYANQILTIIRPFYPNAKIQKFTSETKYDLVVVIGQK